jgi:hypothetical protein
MRGSFLTHDFHTFVGLKRAFSACFRGDLNSWGDAPGFFEAAPLALHNTQNLGHRAGTGAA